MKSQDHIEAKIIRIFRPLLKYARDTKWPEEDANVLNRLFEKSLKSCGGKTTQATITQFFRKKK